ncbi:MULTISPECIES: hypothetical protein [unclassified Alteromonas]|uniref:hypothetical protein n=1 Tax=unclassified Alteromonas TaxID=2614992 RepID=UPI001EF25123|nr:MULTISPECIES: hypothetical protein [unclassified Alteromonas]MCG7638094.1 hypothetical protein [Alteromonas sp. CNT1-28]MCG7813720.1 hypothetical protein [Alteromonas sp. MCA-1]
MLQVYWLQGILMLLVGGLCIATFNALFSGNKKAERLLASATQLPQIEEIKK